MKTVPQSTAASMSLSRTGSAGPPSARQRLNSSIPALSDLRFRRAETYNLKLTIDPSKEKDRLKELSHSIKKMDEELKQLEDERKKTIAAHKQAMNNDVAYNTQFKTEMAQLTAQYREACAQPVSADKIARNEIIAKEIYLSVGRYNVAKRIKAINDLVKVVRSAMKNGLDLNDDATRTDVFDDVAFRVRFLDENEERIHGTCVINLAKLKYAKDWTRIRGRRIATVFQDPYDIAQPDHHHRQADFLHHYEASGLLRG